MRTDAAARAIEDAHALLALVEASPGSTAGLLAGELGWTELRARDALALLIERKCVERETKAGPSGAARYRYRGPLQTMLGRDVLVWTKLPPARPRRGTVVAERHGAPTLVRFGAGEPEPAGWAWKLLPTREAIAC
jgi:hypothetical protein